MDNKIKKASWERIFLLKFSKIDTFYHGFEFLRDLFKTFLKNLGLPSDFLQAPGVLLEEVEF